ncbi:Proteasome adapter and scaffold protein ECM29-like protein [Drosera capensis]
MAEQHQQPPTPAATSDEERVEALDRLLTRLALCDDSKLEPLLSKLLPFTISSLSSPSVYVRNKVLEILSHVNKRVKHEPQIGLPLSELWSMYTDVNAAPMVRNFCIVYIEMAFERSDITLRKKMAPDLLAHVSKLPQQHQDIILRMTMKVIGECHRSQIEEDVVAEYKLMMGSRDTEVFLEFCLHTILYQQSTPRGGISRNCFTCSGVACAGLSVAQSDRVTGKQILTNEALLKRKLGIMTLIDGMELKAEAVYPIYLAACVDSQEAVAKRGEELLKKKGSVADLDNPVLIKLLFSLFNGTAVNENISSEARVVPAHSALKARIMLVFCRSITAANSFPMTLQCIFGCIYGTGTTSRLKQLGMEFAFWVFKHARIDQLKVMGPLILTGIIKSLDGYTSLETDAVSRDAKGFAFQAIGFLSQRLPELFREKIGMAIRLFDALKSEPQFLRPVIQEATISLASAYKGAPTSVLQDVEKLLLSNSQEHLSEVRFCAVRWATSLFDSQHSPSRFLCMVAASDPRLDIREISIEGLFPAEGRSSFSSQKPDIKYPKVLDMLDYIVKKNPGILVSSETRQQKLLFPSKTYVAMIKFLFKCLEEELEQNNLNFLELQHHVGNMCLLLEHALAVEGSVELHAEASRALVVMGSHFPKIVESRYASKISWLRQLLGHVDLDTRESVARLLGMASSALPVSASFSIISELSSSVSGTNKSRFEMQHGALCAIGYVASDCLSRTPKVDKCAFIVEQIDEAAIQSTIKTLVDVVNSESPALASTAAQALGHMGLRASLPPLMGDSGPVAILTILREKFTKLLAGDDTKAIQKIVISLGHLCFRDSSLSHLNVALELIFGLCRSKVEDVLFSAGEALAFLWGSVPVTADVILRTNFGSLSTTSNFLTDGSSSLLKVSSQEKECDEDDHQVVRGIITRKIFDELLYSNRKEERCAGTVWLLSLTMYCGHHPSIQQLLPEIQEAFSHLLGEQNELTQELASQGMSIVYELGDDSMKKNLVNVLVSTLTGSGKRKRAVKLAEDTEVFQEGTIGESPGGGKLSTYKELCSLATEMGQPDLIYKFMDLANYQASLNSKRGAAFGFSRIAKHAGDVLQPHLRSLIPRLVRYQYDPDKNVQDAMAHIWKSLVADSKQTIDEHLDLIIDDLLIQCGSRLWRSRESSCMALTDIIQGRKFQHIGKHLKRIWIAAFRAMDDIKETVRSSGDKLCRAVSSLTVRLCDVSLSDKMDAAQAMEAALPLLLSDGIMSKVDSIRKASITVVMKLAKGAGIAIRPHLSDLVACMLESLSSLEDQGLNYVERHAENIGIQTEKLENLRISIAKGSPMWETLECCIAVVDKESLDLLIPRVAQLVRSGVGLNTRIGVATFITLLVQRINREIGPFANMLLKLLFPAVLNEKSGAAKRAFASSCAMVLNYSTTSQAQKLVEETAALHVGDRNAQVSCAILLKSYASLAGDVVSGYQAIVLPVAFIERFEDDKHVSNMFEELWEETTSGDRVTLQLYLGEIVSIIEESISSSSWTSKRKAAHAVSKLAEILGESLSSYHRNLLNALLKEIPGRLWEGKDSLLFALASVCSASHEAISSNDPSTPAAVLSVVTAACAKKDKKFREAALSALEKVIQAFSRPEFFNMVFPLLYDLSNSGDVKEDVGDSTVTGARKAGNLNKEAEESKDNPVPLDKILDCFTTSIAIAPANDILQHRQQLINVLLYSMSPNFPWTVKISAFLSVKKLCSLLNKATEKEDPLNDSISKFTLEVFLSLSPKIVDCMKTHKIAQVHIAASECLLQVIELQQRFHPALSKDVEFKGELVHLYEIEKNDQAKSLMKRCIAGLENTAE